MTGSIIASRLLTGLGATDGVGAADEEESFSSVDGNVDGGGALGAFSSDGLGLADDGTNVGTFGFI